MDIINSTPSNDLAPAEQTFFDDDLGFLIGKAHRQLRRKWQQSLNSIGITTAQRAALSLLAVNPSLSQREASRMLEIDVMAVRRVLKSLVEKNLVTEEINLKDPRKYCYALTKDGQSLSETVACMAATYNRNLTSLLGPTAVAQMTSFLRHIIEGPPSHELPANEL